MAASMSERNRIDGEHDVADEEAEASTSLADRLRQAIDDSGLPTLRVCKAAGVNRENVVKVLGGGHGQQITAAVALRLCRVLRIDPFWLIFGDGAPGATKQPDPFPNRSRAAEIAREGGVTESAITHVLRATYDLGSDPPVLVWVDLMRAYGAFLSTGSRRRKSSK